MILQAVRWKEGVFFPTETAWIAFVSIGETTVMCSACQHANTDDARFCEQCGHALEICCPACGMVARAGARFCRQCGQHMTQPAEPESTAAVPSPSSTRTTTLDDKLDRLQRYLPSHLTEKILANRGRLEGERKIVTVLFADLASYTALSEHLGEEVMFALMDDLYELFIHEVHWTCSHKSGHIWEEKFPQPSHGL